LAVVRHPKANTPPAAIFCLHFDVHG